jgi:FkbM family methyltransferase
VKEWKNYITGLIKKHNMLIPLKPILEKYNIELNGVAHVGAHWAEEHDDYIDCGLKGFLYVEPIKEAFEVLVQRFAGDSNVKLENVAIGSKSDIGVMCVDTTNQGQSNSLLEPFVHLEQHSEVIFNGDPQVVKIVTLDSIEFPSWYNLFMVDTQGYELEVLKGSTKVLPQFDLLYLEVNRQETYKGCPMVEELDEFLLPFGFHRVETKWASHYHSWGDAIWIKK